LTEQLRSVRLNETAIIQNEALGAFALWTFGLSFFERDGYPVSLPIAFLVLPLVLHGPTLNLVLSTNKASGLHLFVGKLSEKREDLLAVHGRAIALRQLSLGSLMLGEQSGLLRIDPTTASLWSNGLLEGQRAPILPERIRRIAPACERLGHWFAGFSDQQVAHALRVEF
jgi:hypothetical protein